jgi:ABC-2 type transport system ATP-binding protein
MYGMGGERLRRRAGEVLEMIGLSDRANDLVSRYSGGMKRRVNIGVALLHHPQVLFMDEPTVGIDPQSRRNILDNVKALKAQGMTVLYTSHYMEEVQELSDHIAIMDHGQIIAHGTHEELIQLVGEQTLIDLKTDGDAWTQQRASLLADYSHIEGVTNVTAGDSAGDGVGDGTSDGVIHVLCADGSSTLPPLITTAAKYGVPIKGVDIKEPNLEMVFLHLTGKGLRD